MVNPIVNLTFDKYDPLRGCTAELTTTDLPIALASMGKLTGYAQGFIETTANTEAIIRVTNAHALSEEQIRYCTSILAFSIEYHSKYCSARTTVESLDALTIVIKVRETPTLH